MSRLNKYISKELETLEVPITVSEFLKTQEVEEPEEFHVTFDNGRITPDKYGLYTLPDVPDYYKDKIVQRFFVCTFGVNIYINEDII